VELFDPVDGHDHAQALFHLCPLDRRERGWTQVAVDPHPRGRTAFDVKVRAANLSYVSED
jgi:hypothetical protein